MWWYLFELKNGAQGFHHGVLLVVFYQVCEGVELLPSADIVFQVMLKEGDRLDRCSTSNAVVHHERQPRSDGNISPDRTRSGGYLATDHDVGDFWFAVAAVRLVVSCADGQNEVPGVALALPHQEAAVLAFFSQQLLRLSA